MNELGDVSSLCTYSNFLRGCPLKGSPFLYRVLLILF